MSSEEEKAMLKFIELCKYCNKYKKPDEFLSVSARQLIAAHKLLACAADRACVSVQELIKALAATKLEAIEEQEEE